MKHHVLATSLALILGPTLSLHGHNHVDQERDDHNLYEKNQQRIREEERLDNQREEQNDQQCPTCSRKRNPESNALVPRHHQYY